MVDITAKPLTHRMARAMAIVRVSTPKTIEAIQNKTVPKGDVLEAGRVAGLLGVKKTSELIPDCHPIPVEFAAVRYAIEGLEVYIEMEVQAIYRTGVEVEAMHGASVVALTLYDMLKPIDKGVEIHSIRLLEKHGGKTDFKDELPGDFKTAVIVCSDSISAGKKSDTAGREINDLLVKYGIQTSDYRVIPDDIDEIRASVRAFCTAGYHLVLLTGGTGLSPRDHTPEAIRPLLDREIPGISETMRDHGQQRMPYAMLSRSLAGMIGDALIIALPGSTRGARESVQAVFPAVLHLFRLTAGYRHEGKES